MRPFACAVVTFVVALLAPPLQAGEFIRGDANTDGIVDISDPQYILNFLFLQGEGLCLDGMDSNDDGEVDVADVVYALGYLFQLGTEPPAPFTWCGEDPTADGLDCFRNLTCDLGGPIQGLTLDEHRSFNRGREVMLRRFTPSEGLGNPTFNTTSCEACHSTPINGGSSPLYRNFFLVAVGPPGAQVPAPGVPSLAFPIYTGFHSPRPLFPQPSPGFPVTMAHRNAPPMFGTGLFEAVSNATIIGNSDPNDLTTPDGISGRFNTIGGRVGRFGYKLQANFIEEFIRGALFNQMGITSDPAFGSSGAVSLSMLAQIGTDPDASTTDSDGVPDPEMPHQDMMDLVNFNRFLAPPKPLPFGPDEIEGEQIFADIGCVKCHIPELPSSRGPVRAYTDLLLHDLGPDLADGISQGSPQASVLAPNTTDQEFRTQPLWGVRLHGPWLHDGRADTLDEAILYHSGEAEGIKQAYQALTADDQQKLIKFLEAL